MRKCLKFGLLFLPALATTELYRLFNVRSRLVLFWEGKSYFCTRLDGYWRCRCAFVNWMRSSSEFGGVFGVITFE